MLKATSSIVNVSQITGVLPVVNGGTGVTTSTGTGNNVLATTPTLVGDVTLSTGNLVVADTKGIDFSATPGTGTSELLNDYEEGTFTPNLLFGGGNTGMTGTFVGRYTKVGRVVYYAVVIFLSAKGSSTGNTTISGFPFTSSASSTFYEGKMDSDNVSGLLFEFVAQMGTSTTTLNVYVNNAGTLNNVSDSSYANNSRFYVTGFYEA